MVDRLLDNLAAGTGPLIVEGSLARNVLACAALATFRKDQAVLASADEAGTAYGAALLATWPAAPARPPPHGVAPLAPASALAARERWRRLVDGAGT
jgi:hypothetical protein